MNLLEESNLKYGNRMVARVMLITFYIFTVAVVLNEIGLFRFNRRAMFLGYLACSVLLVTPNFLLHQFSSEKRSLGRVFIILAALFTTTFAAALSYHAIILYIYPLALSGLYYSRRMNVLATICTAASIAMGQALAHYINPLPNLNFRDTKALIFWDILPKEMCFMAIAAIYFLMTERSSFMVHALKSDAKRIRSQHDEMIMGFASMVENRDNSTGGHIKRTKEYVEMILRGLKERGVYTQMLDDRFVENMIMAAPLHDVGKITTPDSILTKPGKLTDEEYATMKKHAPEGRRILNEILDNSDEAYKKIAMDVAGFHHEKWNGKGYPVGLEGEQIPLSARIMAVADVFDAVSEKRCYRDAMPMDKCFAIIEGGSGTDFDPEIVKVFVEMRSEVERIHGILNQ